MGNRSTAVLQDEEFKVIAEKTKMTVEEVEKQYVDFLQTLSGSDSKISKKEFRKTIMNFHPEMKQVKDKKDAKKLQKYVFRMYDTNDNGSIDFDEFMIVFYMMMCENLDERLKYIFRIYDKNQDGSISRKEVKKIVEILYKLLSDEEKSGQTEKDITEMVFKEMDENVDGKVTEQEFIGAVNKADSISKILNQKLGDIVQFRLNDPKERKAIDSSSDSSSDEEEEAKAKVVQ